MSQRIVTHFPSNGPFRISANKSHGMHRFNDADLTFLVVLGIIVLLLGGLYCFNSKFRGKQESVKSVEQESDLSRREEGNSKVLPSICRAWCSQKFDPFYQCLLPLDTDQLTKQYLHYSRKASKIWQSMCLAEQKHVKNQLVGFALLLFGNSAHENIIKMLGGQLRTIECVEKQARNYGYLN